MYDFGDDYDSSSTIFRDVIMLALMGFVAILILILPHVNPPKQDEAKDITPPGNLMVQIFWEDDQDIDVDLWVKAPNDTPVGWNSNGKIFNLLRDDLGRGLDNTHKNYEMVISRGAVQGEYTLNVVLYADRRGKKTYPVEVYMQVSLKKADNDAMKMLFEKRIKLWKITDEVTVFNFRLDPQFNVIKSSVNSLFVPLAVRPTAVPPAVPPAGQRR
jgi:hypothetical protein